MKYEIEIPDGSIHPEWEPIEIRCPVKGEKFYSLDTSSVLDATYDCPCQRLIVRKKDVEKKARPYNAEEMKGLYLGRARFVTHGVCVDAIGYDPSGIELLVGEVWLSAFELQRDYAHIGGARCEVLE